MRTSAILFMLFFLTANFASSEQVTLHPKKIFLPAGFDSNDESQAFVTVDLPNTCYKKPTGKANISGRDISVEVTATLTTGEVCIQAVVPYLVPVSFGKLREGRYLVKATPEQRSSLTGELIILKPNSDSIDNFPYANVTNIKPSNDNSVLIVEGYHPSSCMEIDRVETLVNAYGDTISVLPIIKQNAPICDQSIKPFTFELPVKNNNLHDMVFHVRKLDGNALNYRWQLPY